MEPRSRPFVLLSSLTIVIVVTAFLVFPFGSKHTDAEFASRTTKDIFKAPRRNVWAELTEKEAASVNDFIFEELSHLNLTKRPKEARDNFIFYVETLRPNKTDVIPYLYEDGPCPPERWAKAAISQNTEKGPYMLYYMVGPLPISKESSILPLTYAFNSGKHYVPNPIQDFAAVLDFGMSVAENISDITQELLGAVANRDHPDDPDGLLAIPHSSRVGERNLTVWIGFWRPGLGSGARTLLPQGIYAKVEALSSDLSHWTVGEFYYNGIVYENVQAFRDAIKSPDFKPTPANIDGDWTNTEDFQSKPDGRELPPPVIVQPYGPRYKLDKKEQYVSWFGFEFYITTARVTGISLFDIRFKGERVMYELGLQEAMAHYAGDDPMQAGLVFLDSFYGMGKNSFELVHGYDCPAYADYLDVEWYQVHETYHQSKSICIFEYTADSLLSRHTAQYSVTASRNTYLVVRSVSTVGNYDYTISYLFYLDGSLEVKVQASGFIFAAFYAVNGATGEDEYGHRIHNALSSSMHDHVINFKADLDVAGSTNDFVRMAIEPVTTSYQWDQPEQPKQNTMHLVEYPVVEEIGLDWPKNSGEFYIVYSSDQKNAWGERRGYRITPGTGMGNSPHLTITNSTALGDSARWAEHDLWVVQGKDTEPRSADPLNYLDPHDPLIDFNKIADHEALDHRAPDAQYDGDLVIYFNIGAHHVPHSGDVPNTLMHTSASSVMFVPHNFNDRDPSRESVQGVRLQLIGEKSGGFAGQLGESGEPNGDRKYRMDTTSPPKNGTNATYFGGTYNKGMKLPLEALEPNMDVYKSREHSVTDLNFNGSAAGVWHRAEAFRV